MGGKGTDHPAGREMAGKNLEIPEGRAGIIQEREKYNGTTDSLVEPFSVQYQIGY